MKYLSVCSGIEAATCAWQKLGWEAVGFSEIEKFPSAVLAYHFPNVKNFGDMTKYKEWDVEPFDLLVGGTPCQAFSIAGLRKGLEDPRGNLTLVFLAMVDYFKPKYVVWENVPGVLSDKTGALEQLLQGFNEIGYVFDTDILDAQFFGVPQRRRRVFVTAVRADYINSFGGENERETDGELFRESEIYNDQYNQLRKASDTIKCLFYSTNLRGEGTGEIQNIGESSTGNTEAECKMGQRQECDPDRVERGVRRDDRRRCEQDRIIEKCAFEEQSYSSFAKIDKVASTLEACGGMLGNGGDNIVVQITYYNNHPQESRVTESNGIAHTLTSYMKCSTNLPFAKQTMYKTHPQDSRFLECGDISDTVTSRYGTGGGNTPLVTQKVYKKYDYTLYKETDSVSAPLTSYRPTGSSNNIVLEEINGR